MTSPSASSVAEIVTFRLTDGMTDDAFLDLMGATQGFTSYAPGFMSRQLSKADDGTWTDYVVWSSLDYAQKAAAGFSQQDFAPAILNAIDKDSFSTRHHHILWQPS